MKSEETKVIPKKFALDVINLVGTFPRSEADIIGRQLIKSATSVGANYRSACRVQSRAQFISKMSVVLEEADESQYWLELALTLNLSKKDKTISLFREADESTVIFVKSLKTAKKKK